MLKVVSVMGEFPQLTDDEWPAVVRTAVQAADGKVDIIAGTHYKDTKRTIQDARRAQDLGAIGLQIAPPAMNDPNQDDILRFYSDVSDAIDIGVMIYNTPWWPYGSIYVDTFRKMADFEHIAAIKWAVPEGAEFEDIFELKDTFNIIDNTVQPIRNHKLGGRGYVQNELGIYPHHDLRIWELMEAGRYEEAEALFDSVVPKLRAFGEEIGNRSGHKGGAKAIMQLMGRPIGLQRPPATALDARETAELRDLVAGFGWPIAEQAAVAAD
jgi:4-hydroxy-tetrahydrodipicolinate synthase